MIARPSSVSISTQLTMAPPFSVEKYSVSPSTIHRPEAMGFGAMS